MTANEQSQFEFDFDETEDEQVDDEQTDVSEQVDDGTTDYTPTDEIDISVGLDNLTLDERVRLAEKGRKSDLDVLVHDKDYRVRELVAHHGYATHLNKLVKDEDIYVRWEVIGHRRQKDIDVLIHDSNPELNIYAKQLNSSSKGR